jgi:ectoine hydroxylase-related dioxygenase (phytanoyl-CoA dioxygenase family)
MDELAERYLRDGYVKVEGALSASLLRCLKDEFAAWVEESKTHSGPFGTTYDGRPRFDVESDHTQTLPALRRVASPIDISDSYRMAVRNNGALDALKTLASPNLRFHHCKINSKLPGATTAVKYHQDFLFEPHTNTDLATVLFFLDDVTEDNGPLEVVPGSHKGPLYSLWQHGRFTGAVEKGVEIDAQKNSVRCTGRAGDACIMHTKLLHGSAPNRSHLPRTLFICCYAAADSLPLSPNPLPTAYAGELVAGSETNKVRCENYEGELPEVPKGASFFNQQEQAES